MAQIAQLAPPLRPKQNPREHLSTHRERGKAAYRFTQEDVARCAGAPISAVRRAKTAGVIPDYTLEGVIPWIFAERQRRMKQDG